MEENKNKTIERVDWTAVLTEIWVRRKLFYKTLPLAFILSSIFIYSKPKYYTSEVKLAPELGSSSSKTGGSLGALASSFGIDLNRMQTNDAITPLLYPDLMEDNSFVYSLLNVKVYNQDNNINTTYYDYLKNYQKLAWWEYPIDWLSSLKQEPEDKFGQDGYDPNNITRKENKIYKKARRDIKISVDKKTRVIAISVTSQDPLICRTLGDSIKDKLQVFITQYRTNKARIDYEYYQKLTDSARIDFEKQRLKYAHMSDASTHVTLKSATQRLQDIANDTQEKYSIYTKLNAQLEAAKAKVQECTPAFTILKAASVPVKPTGPRRVRFVFIVVLLAAICTSGYIMWEIIKTDRK